MRQINIRTLKAKLSAEMKDLPFEITRNGKVIGVVLFKGTDNALRFDITKNTSTRNNNIKATISTGGRQARLRQDKGYWWNFFNSSLK